MQEKKEIKKKDYIKIKDYNKQNIIMAVLEKASFHLVHVCRLIKSQSRKNNEGERLIQTYFF